MKFSVIRARCLFICSRYTILINKVSCNQCMSAQLYERVCGFFFYMVAYIYLLI